MEIKIVDEKILEKFGSHVKYCLVECDTCFRSWGANCINGHIRKDQLVCQVCSAKIVANSK